MNATLFRLALAAYLSLTIPLICPGGVLAAHGHSAHFVFAPPHEPDADPAAARSVLDRVSSASTNQSQGMPEGGASTGLGAGLHLWLVGVAAAGLAALGLMGRLASNAAPRRASLALKVPHPPPRLMSS